MNGSTGIQPTVELATTNGTMMDNKEFVRWYLDTHYNRGKIIPRKVYEVADIYKDNIVLCTMNGHIVCIKYGIIYDTFDPSNRNVEFVWVVK